MERDKLFGWSDVPEERPLKKTGAREEKRRPKCQDFRCLRKRHEWVGTGLFTESGKASGIFKLLAQRSEKGARKNGSNNRNGVVRLS